jgi:hypothetical protein
VSTPVTPQQLADALRSMRPDATDLRKRTDLLRRWDAQQAEQGVSVQDERDLFNEHIAECMEALAKAGFRCEDPLHGISSAIGELTDIRLERDAALARATQAEAEVARWGRQADSMRRALSSAGWCLAEAYGDPTARAVALDVVRMALGEKKEDDNGSR